MRPLIVLLISFIWSILPARAAVIDEVVAAVGNAPILRSDLALAELVRLVEPAPGETADELASRLLEARIRLELQFRDLEGSGTLYRLDLDVPAVRTALAGRAGDGELLQTELAAYGLTAADLDELALRLAAVDAYIEQRLRPRVRVTPDEVRTAYQDLIVAAARQAGQTPPELDSVRDDLRRLLVERSLNDAIELWLVSAAEQNEVTRYRLR